MNKTFYINSFAFWTESQECVLPDVTFVPALIRRRLTDVEKIGLFLANKVCKNFSDYYVVFASRFGEWGQTIKLINQFATENEMSPAGFSNSVHNAMPGILSVLSKNTKAYTAIAARDKTLDNALLEAFCGKLPVLFIYAEERMPDVYTDVMQGNVNCGMGGAFLISGDKVGTAIDINFEMTGKSVSFDELKKFFESDDEKFLETAYFMMAKV